MKHLLTLLLFFSVFSLQSQNDLVIGQWESHLPYAGGKSVTQSDTKIYFGTGFSVAVIDKDDKTFQRISKTDGLSNIGVTNVKYHPTQKTLMVIYDDGVIDLVPDEGDLTTLFFIKDFNNIVGKKIIYDIHVSGEETFLLGTNYGISEVNIVTNEFVFTTFTNELRVFGICKYDGYIYAAAEDGLYRVSENNVFIDAFGQWEYLGTESGLPEDYSAGAVAVYNDELYVGVDTSVLKVNPTESAEVIFSDPELNVGFLSAEGNKLIIGYDGNGARGKTLTFDRTDNTVTLLPAVCATRPLDAIEDERGRIWIADSFAGYHVITGDNCGILTTDSPPSVRNNTLEIYNDELWVTSGGISLNSGPLGFIEGFYSYIDNDWTTFNAEIHPILNEVTDFVPIVIHPETGDVYAGSYYDGLIHYDRETLNLIDDSTSSMNNAVGDDARTRVSGLAFDSENNLWVSNYLGANPISVMRADGSWEDFACNSTKLIGVTIDDFDNKWMTSLQSSVGFVVFDEKENRCKSFSTGNSVLESNQVNCITKDLDGDMWVGTQEGIVIFECGDPFDSNCIGSQRIVEVDGVAAALLKDENVRSITIDGANRKWIGTSNGIFVLSPDGREQIVYLSEDNSPLFDNVINDIAIDGKTGKVYIGTDKGIQALRGQATTGGAINVANPNVFPNPVRPEYTGPIAINGLATDANVKITDAMGQLIYETQALGGQAIWDGNDYNGRRAASGVYLVLSTRTSNLNQSDAVVAKILIMN
ncbi:MAG: sugar lactone lactonase YvrE [Saprospiraceae bacterium]|jgi:sugar lactone lactonase YvrE